jgi:hypothetical protein
LIGVRMSGLGVQHKELPVLDWKVRMGVER